MSSSLQTLIRDLHRRRGRERRGLALAEGIRLVEEAIAAGVPMPGAVASQALESTTRGRGLKAALTARGIRVEDVTDDELVELADTEHPQGIVAVIEPKRWSLSDLQLSHGGTVLALDAVQDPGNVGTMIRTALGLGALGLVGLKGTADLTNSKVIRGAMGATFRLPTPAASPEELIAWARLQRAQIWVADRAGQTPDRIRAASTPGRGIVLVLGNEGAGVGPALDASADQRISIPLSGEVESLNVAVAAGILLYEVTRGV
ncbi:MAG TPA: RNA methyltransferase [Gemmatimonadales bacterium]|nr:RNA methyltransferase [Gemmatimonadales bacterium]